jgi:undecaprenyl-diphosphatase
LVVALALLVLITLPIERARVPTWEKDAFETINTLPDWLNPPVQAVMQLGNMIAVPVIALLAFLVWRRWRVAIDLTISGTAAWLLARVMKNGVGRGRPGDLLEDVILRDAPSHGLGFVSGHTAVAAALATVFAAYLGARATIVAIVLAALVGFGRIYVGAHLPLDVVGGALMGWAIGSLIHFFVLPELTGMDPDELAPAE